jgi:uncharacterized phage-associated protein
MKTLDEILKIKAVVTYILQKMPEGIDYIHLFKMVYFAQQEHLKIYGMPLMDDTFKARKHGPVPSLTYKVLQGVEGKRPLDTEELRQFASVLKVEQQGGHQWIKIVPGTVCDMDELSGANIKVLDKWIEKCKDVRSFDLSDLSHDSAWQHAKEQTEKTGEDTKITLYDMAEAAGASKDMLRVIRERQINHKLTAWI